MQYDVYLLGTRVKTFTSRDAAIDWIIDQPQPFDDFEVLDPSG